LLLWTTVDSKNTESTVEALQSFVGDATIKRFYSDNADELVSAARFLNITHEASQQGIPQTNGIIQREVQDMLTGTRTLLVAVGMPGLFGHMPRRAICTSTIVYHTLQLDSRLGSDDMVKNSWDSSYHLVQPSY
jgi:transposase InsO family protein